jgi:hypothetical protein
MNFGMKHIPIIFSIPLYLLLFPHVAIDLVSCIFSPCQEHTVSASSQAVVGAQRTVQVRKNDSLVFLVLCTFHPRGDSAACIHGEESCAFTKLTMVPQTKKDRPTAVPLKSSTSASSPNLFRCSFPKH